MKIFKALLIAMVTASAVLSSQTAIAQRPNPSERSVCERIDQLAEQTQKSMQMRKTPVQTTSNTSDDQKEPQLQKYQQIRQRADSMRKEHFETIVAKLKTDSQKTAVRDYRTKLDSATEERREAINSAQQEFDKALQELKNGHQQSVITMEEKFVNEINTAFESAKMSCAGGENSQLVQAQLINDIKSAKQDLAKAKLSLSVSVQKYQQLIQSRNKALNIALTNFKKSELQAKQDLVSSLQTKS